MSERRIGVGFNICVYIIYIMFSSSTSWALTVSRSLAPSLALSSSLSLLRQRALERQWVSVNMCVWCCVCARARERGPLYVHASILGSLRVYVCACVGVCLYTTTHVRSLTLSRALSACRIWRNESGERRTSPTRERRIRFTSTKVLAC